MELPIDSYCLMGVEHSLLFGLTTAQLAKSQLRSKHLSHFKSGVPILKRMSGATFNYCARDYVTPIQVAFVQFGIPALALLATANHCRNSPGNV